jgi:hypothetical protein
MYNNCLTNILYLTRTERERERERKKKEKSSMLRYLYNSDNIVEGYDMARQIINSTDKELKDTLIITPNTRKNCKLHEGEICSNCISESDSM